MNAAYHIQITQEALANQVSPAALNTILAGNLGQDGLAGLLWHPEFHFDDNSFKAGFAYIDQQRALVFAALKQGNPHLARKALGRLTHSLQDFYAHSNFVQLWVLSHPQRPPEEIDYCDEIALSNPMLHSGRIYFPLDWLSFLPLLGRQVKRFIPRDSHAWMNLDGPEAGPFFAFALSAARKHTAQEFQLILSRLDPDAERLLFG
jgi:hypothetical protein